MMENDLYRGDDTDAFGQDYMNINVNVPDGWVVKKAEWRAGNVLKTFENPVFPISVVLNKTESIKLQNVNVCYLAIYDEQGRKQTCEGSLKFMTRAEVV